MASLCPLPHLTWPPPLCPGASFQHHALGQHRPHRAKAQGPLCSGALNEDWAWLWQGGSVPACAGVSHALLDPWRQSQASGSYLRQEGCGGDPLDLIHAAVCAQERLHHQGQPGACKLHHGTVEAGHTMQGVFGPPPRWGGVPLASCPAVHPRASPAHQAFRGAFPCPLPGLAATSAAHSCLSGPHSPTALWADTPTHAGPTYDGS